MSRLKVSELFYSIQGEGRYMGVPSVFLRTFGCNFTCDGFNMPPGEKSNERNVIANNAGEIKVYKELPLVSTGCDSYASWDVRFKHLSPMLSIDAVVDGILDILPHNEWKDEHLVITGGEPLLGWQRAYPDLLSHSRMDNLKELTFETNGTQPLSDELYEFLSEWTFARVGYDNLTLSVSPKLSASGESWDDAIKPEIVSKYSAVGYTYLKFVISNLDHLIEAETAVEAYRDHGFDGPVYLMPVGGTSEVYNMNNRQVAEYSMVKGWRYSDRLQVPLFKNEWGT